MKVAYLISAYQDEMQLKRLIEVLSCKENYFFIHIDKKINIDKFKNVLKSFENVFFVENRVFVSWAGYSQVKAILSMIELMLSTKIEFDRVLSITGLDYPLVNNEKIINEFEKNPSKQYMIGFNISKCKTKKQWNKIQNYYFQDLHIKNRNISSKITGILNRLVNILHIRKKMFTKEKDDFDIYMSSDYWALTYECVKELYYEYLKNDKLKKYFKTSFAPSELFMTTMVFNSKYAKDAELFDSNEYTCLADLTKLHYIDYSNGIIVFDENDFDRLMDSKKMFARKFTTGKSDKLIEMINKEIKN